MLLLSLLRQSDADIRLANLFIVDRRRCAAHEVGAALGFGEGDDVADVGDAAEDHDEAVEADGDAAVGRSAVLEGIQEEAELGFLGGFVDAQEGEDFLLDVDAVDTDGAAADFGAVDDDVVGLAQDRFDDLGVAGIELGEIFIQRRSEGVMGAGEAFFGFVEFEGGEFDDPDPGKFR